MNIYNYAFLDESTKREIRRKTLMAVSIPGYQVPFGSREMPIARGWGTGGLQLTLSLLGSDDVLKVIDQGTDESVNACSLREFMSEVAQCEATKDTVEASIVQTRHRIPEEKMDKDQILVFQVPIPDPLRSVEPNEGETRRMHAEKDYSKMWVYLYEQIVKYGEIQIGHSYPVLVNESYVMDPSPIPRFDIPKLHKGETLFLFGAGREKRIYAVPPYTKVEPLAFEDYHFSVEEFEGECCEICGSTETYLDETFDSQTGRKMYQCSDTSYCEKIVKQKQGQDVQVGGKWHGSIYA